MSNQFENDGDFIMRDIIFLSVLEQQCHMDNWAQELASAEMNTTVADGVTQMATSFISTDNNA